jgi:hypothetical protein
MMVAPQESQKRTARRLIHVISTTAGTPKSSAGAGAPMATVKPMNNKAKPIVKGGHTLRFKEAFLLKKKKPAENNPNAIQTAKKIGKT